METCSLLLAKPMLEGLTTEDTNYSPPESIFLLCFCRNLECSFMVTSNCFTRPKSTFSFGLKIDYAVLTYVNLK